MSKEYCLLVTADGNDADYATNVVDMEFASDKEALAYRDALAKFLAPYKSCYDDNQIKVELMLGWHLLDNEERELIWSKAKYKFDSCVDDVWKYFNCNEYYNAEILSFANVPMCGPQWNEDGYPHTVQSVRMLKQFRIS